MKCSYTLVHCRCKVVILRYNHDRDINYTETNYLVNNIIQLVFWVLMHLNGYVKKLAARIICKYVKSLFEHRSLAHGVKTFLPHIPHNFIDHFSSSKGGVIINWD